MSLDSRIVSLIRACWTNVSMRQFSRTLGIVSALAIGFALSSARIVDVSVSSESIWGQTWRSGRAAVDLDERRPGRRPGLLYADDGDLPARIFVPYASLSDRISKRGLVHTAQLSAAIRSISGFEDIVAVAEGRHVAFYDSGLEIWRSEALPAPVLGVDWDSELLCVALGERGLGLFRVEEFFGASLEQIIDAPAAVLDVDCEGGLAFVALRSDGLRILDVSDPVSPVWRGRILAGRDIGLFHVQDDLAHIRTSRSDGIGQQTVVDVGDPDRPVEITTVRGVYSASTDDTLFVEGTSPDGDGLQVYEIDRSSRTARWLFRASELINRQSSNGLGSRGRELFRASLGTLDVIRVFEPHEPALLAVADGETVATADDAVVVAPSSSRLVHVYNTESNGNMSRVDSFDVATPSAPRTLRPLVRVSPSLIVPYGRQLLVAPIRKNGDFPQVDLYDLTTPGRPKLAGWTRGWLSSELKAIDSHVAVRFKNRELIIHDLSAPLSPRPRGRVVLSSITGWEDPSVVLGDDGRTMYSEHRTISAPQYHQRAYDITDRDHPLLLGEFSESVDSYADGVIFDRRMYLARNGTDLNVLEFANDGRGSSAHIYDALSRPGKHHTALVGDVLVVGTDSVVDVLDLSEPLRPRRVSSFDLRAAISHVSGRGDIAIVTTSELDSALVAVDVSDPESPRVISRAQWPDQAAMGLGVGLPIYSVIGDGFVATVAVDPKGRANAVEVFTPPWLRSE